MSQTPTYAVPAFNDVIRYKGGDLAALPDVSHPYYVQAENGLFMHIRLGDLGRGLVRQHNGPKMFPKLELGWHGDGNVIPNALCKQIWAFFRHHKLTRSAEAEVILTMHTQTKEWRVFIPTQLTSSGGVNSVYDPSVIHPDWRVVGTMHSHPGSAFHSGTDTADADNMNGLHLTLGNLDSDTPDIAAMVSVNKQKYDYKDTSMVADFSDLTDATFPEWWNRYIGGHSDKPVGYDLFAKFQKPTTIRTETQKWVPKPQTNGWHPQKTPTSIVPYQTQYGDMLAMRDDEWDAYLEARYGVPGTYNNRLVTPPLKPVHNTKMLYDDYWEETLPAEQVIAITRSNILTDEDIDHALDQPQDSQYTAYWRDLYITKLQDSIEVLEKLGVTLTYQMDLDFSNDNAPMTPPTKETTDDRPSAG